MAVNASELTKGYFDRQRNRVHAALDRIGERGASVAAGRVIPAAEDLVIGSGRRLLASVLFLDISGFSQRPAETEEEQAQLLNLLSLFFTEFIRIVEDFGGTVEKNTGDGFMAYFGASAGGATSIPQTAVAAALTIFAAADRLLNPVLAELGLVPIDFRICIDHGAITVARIGAAQRFGGIVAIGTTANVAAKMLALAEPNTLLLGDRAALALPLDWQVSWVRLERQQTGWHYREDGSHYPFWRYTGRWTVPGS